MKRTLLSPTGILILASMALAEESGMQSMQINSGDTAWMIMAAALVMLMSVPGLALFYGGLAKRKDALNTIAMTLSAFAIVSVLWIVYGYALTFGKDISGFIGSPSKFFLSDIHIRSVVDVASTIPEYVFVVYQLTFAAITVALVSGAFIERMKFSAWVIFTVLWMTFVYVPVSHWVWGGGFLAKMGALDFAGGTVVHLNAGIAALVGVILLGKRRDISLIPHNLTMVVTGTGLLWFGWFGFNAGSALSANGIAGVAFINTNTAAAVGSISWMMVEWLTKKKPTLLGLCSGAVSGLVTITPAAGFVNVPGALIMGILAGVVPYLVVTKIKPMFGYDDALDVFGIHGIAGMLGALLTGIFADPSINEAGRGVLYGNPGQLLKQLIATVVTIVHSGGATALLFYLIRALTGARSTIDDEIIGLDESVHGEKAYNLHT